MEINLHLHKIYMPYLHDYWHLHAQHWSFFAKGEVSSFHFRYGGCNLPMELTSYNHNKAPQWGSLTFTLRIAGRCRNWMYLITFTDYICFEGAKRMLTPSKQLDMLGNWLDHLTLTTWLLYLMHSVFSGGNFFASLQKEGWKEKKKPTNQPTPFYKYLCYMPLAPPCWVGCFFFFFSNFLILLKLWAPIIWFSQIWATY